MKIISKVLKIIFAAANWICALLLSLAACSDQSVGMFVAASIWLFVVLMVFPIFKGGGI
jgi:hypothetical protein